MVTSSPKKCTPLQEQRPHCVYLCYKNQVPNCVSPKNQAGVTNISNVPWKCTTSSYWKGVKKDLSCSSLSSPIPTPHPQNLGNCDFFPYYFHARHALNSACERVHSFPAEQGGGVAWKISPLLTLLLGKVELWILPWVVLVWGIFKLGFVLFFWHSMYPHRKHSLPVLRWWKKKKKAKTHKRNL